VRTLVRPNGADFDPATLHDWPEHADSARKVVIPGASHHPPVETPEEFNRVLLDYLKGRG
jgi:pimeloyl-ACP methyl ester carboxylesterase